MSSIRSRSALVAAAVFASSVMFIAPAVEAAIDVAKTPLSCGDACTWSVTVDGGTQNEPRWEGTFGADPQTGDLSLAEPRTWNDPNDPGAWVSINDVFGNIDPVLGFSVAANTGAIGKTFAFAFSMPVALSGPIAAHAEVGYTLTATSPAGAQIQPLFGKTVIAQEVDTSIGGLPPLDKGVNVGEIFSFVPGPATMQSMTYSASSVIAGSLAYDLMSVTVAFALSPDSNVGISGFVEQTPVPVPAAIWLLSGALVGLAAIRRRPPE